MAIKTFMRGTADVNGGATFNANDGCYNLVISDLDKLQDTA